MRVDIVLAILSVVHALKLGQQFRVARSLAPKFSIAVSAGLSVAALSTPDAVNAAVSEYGILAGRTASLLHPATNIALFVTTLYSAYLGLQWRRLRYLGENLRELNSQLPLLSTGQAKLPLSTSISSVTKQIESLDADAERNAVQKSVLLNDLSLLKGAADLELRIQELTATRKDLLAGNLRDKHHITGSVLLGAGVTVSVLGAFNTYMRTGKLFPGPHLYGGMSITILWAGMDACFSRLLHCFYYE